MLKSQINYMDFCKEYSTYTGVGAHEGLPSAARQNIIAPESERRQRVSALLRRISQTRGDTVGQLQSALAWGAGPQSPSNTCLRTRHSRTQALHLRPQVCTCTSDSSYCSGSIIIIGIMRFNFVFWRLGIIYLFLLYPSLYVFKFNNSRDFMIIDKRFERRPIAQLTPMYCG